MPSFVPKGFGWQPDLPDGRDYTFRHSEVIRALKQLRRSEVDSLPEEIDLRNDGDGDYFTGVDNQVTLNSSSAFAVLGMVEYFERRVHARTFDGSKLFLYQLTRHRIEPRQQTLTDAGADLRTTLKVLTQIGVPSEKYWPYEVDSFTCEPTAVIYAFAKPFNGLRYFRLDEPNATGEATWFSVKSFLAAGFPILFGFSVPSSLTADPNIPFRPDLDAPRGGQCVIGVGYRLNHYGPKQDAILIRSSWGSQWGDNGNGWLPVSFIRSQLARDFWCFISNDWLDTCELTQPLAIDATELTCDSIKKSACLE